ncbi:MAG: hypothetical protein RLZZ200_1511 [Pseudomonadota bacterium]|jgi:ribose transport system ATP-binding protein
MQPMDVLLSASGLDKAFPGVVALRDARFELRAGEVHALMGENGAGKSTLVKILAGVHRRDAGEVLLAGQAVDIDGPAEAQALGISIIHQELQLMPHLTAAQNVFIGREPSRFGWLDERRLNRDAAELFQRIHLDIDPTTPVGTMTVARQQMVEIAKALSRASRVLVMDEPTSALNDLEIAELFKVIDKLRSEGVGIIYISHRMDEIQRIADRITVMRDGGTVGTMPASTPLPQVIALMVGRELAATRSPVPDSSDAAPALEVKGLSRGRLVRDVSFAVKRGEIVAFAGLMGAGRTEVMRTLFGADRAESGEIFVHGKQIRVRGPVDAVAAGIGYLPEDRKHHGLATGMDVESNITLPSLSRCLRAGLLIDRQACAEMATRFVERLRIRTPSNHQIARLLSGGNQQKVVIAKWLARECDVLIFDEPTRGIDVGAKAEIYSLLAALAAEGRAIIVVSSELPEILQLGHRILVMCEGRIAGELPGEHATQETIMALATAWH